jgi:hypothetical protein
MLKSVCSRPFITPFWIIIHYPYNNNNNNNQVFYSQASWGRLEMESHKNRYKIRAKKKGKTKGDKKIKSKKEKR